MICAAADCEVEFENTTRQQKYHSEACRIRSKRHREDARARQERADAPPTEYRGRLVPTLIDSGIGRQAITEKRTNVWVASELAVLTGNVSQSSTIAHAMRAVRHHYDDAAAFAAWEMDWTTKKMLMLHRPAPERIEGPEFESWLQESADRFFEFEQTFWTLADETLFIRKPFHRRWVIEILRAIETGGKLLILSPPRHGKSELLQHLCVWLICRRPNIRIIWVGPNGPIAEESVGAIKEILDVHRELIASVLGPGGSFAPTARTGGRWSEKRFTVNTRTVRGMKAPTMTAMGRAAKTLSKDADLIVADDLEDHESTAQPAPREDTRRWFFTQLQSRKQINTAWFCIGSRQHPDDLWGYLREDDSWQVIEETAHDPLCQIDPYDIADHVDCMLFPEVNPYKWLFENWVSARTLGEEHLYEMVYLNNPRPEGTLHWTRELIRLAYNEKRGLGIPQELSADSELFLIGGLDPAATRFQAAFLWAVELIPPKPHPQAQGVMLPGRLKEWMVDLDNHQGGGVDTFIDGVAQGWLEKYGLRHWVVEYNLYRHVFSKHERILRWAQENNITLEYIETRGQNKWDPTYGVGAMRQMYVAEPIEIDLPVGDPEARAKTEIYAAELLRYTDDPVALRKRMTNVLMASWFPQRTARRWLSELVARSEDQGFFNEFSYPEADISEDYDQAPW